MNNLIVFFALINALIDPSGPKFKEQLIDDKIEIGYGVALGDVDGDGKPDIMVADKKQFVWYRNGDWRKFIMTKDLTQFDNVCIAARDIDGDGKVEVAVGAQWNPSETSDTARSGSVHYLVRPKDPTQLWTAIQLHSEPTVHRMRWVKTHHHKYQLIVVPLHGRGNKNGSGAGVKVFAYEMPTDVNAVWKRSLVDSSMHMTHNFDVVQGAEVVTGRDTLLERIAVGGKEGVRMFAYLTEENQWTRNEVINGFGVGEIRMGSLSHSVVGLATIEPMHGNHLVFYENYENRIVLTDKLAQGHALAMADVLNDRNTSRHEIVVGWREPDDEKKVGVKLYVYREGKWLNYWIDDNGMACEDIQVADLNNDGKLDIVASGRATHNVKIYWNRN
jgi:hypothetical protein